MVPSRVLEMKIVFFCGSERVENKEGGVTETGWHPFLSFRKDGREIEVPGTGQKDSTNEQTQVFKRSTLKKHGNQSNSVTRQSRYTYGVDLPFSSFPDQKDRRKR